MFEVPEHVPLMYCPDVHPAHDLHAKPLLVPLHDPSRYCWLPQLVLEQGLQTPGLLPDRHWLGLQATLEINSHLYPLDVPLQLPVRR